MRVTPGRTALRGLTAVTLVVLSLLVAPTADAAVRVSSATLSGGALRVQGSRAAASATVTVRSTTATASARADRSGNWTVTAAAFTAPTCSVSVNDGTGSVAATLTGCTPAGPPPANRLPVAAAGPDQSVADADGDGFAQITLDGRASSDPDGRVTAYAWVDQSAGDQPLGTDPSVTVLRSIGTHVVKLTVTDDRGGQAVDSVTVTVGPAADPQPQGASAVLQSDQAWSGAFDSALTGSSVDSAGDVNGDGFDDVVVGAYGYDAPGGSFDEGAAFVFLGSAQGVVGNTPATAHAAVIGTRAGAELGTGVAGVGDVNGDGFDDIMVGAPRDDSDGLAASGAAYLFLGSARGITARGPADAAAVLHSGQIEGQLGYYVAGAGDVDRDGYADVLVGAQFYGKPFDPPIPNQGSGRFGASFVFRGGPDGLVGRTPATAHAQLLPWLIGTAGQTVSGMGTSGDGAGDVNGDGYDDIVVGAPGFDASVSWPGTDTANPFQEGAAYVFLGGPRGIASPTVAHARIESGQLQAALGNAVAGAGDLNGDGFDDIVVGAPQYPLGDPLLLAQNGAAFVFHGSADGIRGRGPAEANARYLASQTADWVGRAVGGAGDVDGDGYADLLIGARSFVGAIPDDATYNGSTRLTGEGAAYLLRGSAAGVPSGLAAASTRIGSGQEAGSAGYDLDTAGDVNRDGLSDVIVGVPGWSGGHLREGAAFVRSSGAGGTGTPPPTSPPPASPPANAAPVADAGPDQVVLDSDGDGSQPVGYDGSASRDTDGAIVSWTWTVTDANGTPLSTQLGNERSFTVRQEVGTYTVRLSVADDRGGTATDTVRIEVKAAPAQAASATVTATAPATVTRGATFTVTARVTNTGSAPLSGATATLALTPTGLTRDASTATVVVPTLGPGASSTLSWTARADRTGTVTAAVRVSASGRDIATATTGVTIR